MTLLAALAMLAAACNVDGSYTAANGDEVPSPRCKGFGSKWAHYLCRDGSYSHSEHRSGACSRHGGIERALNPGENE